jgi:hypothetical protein
VLASILPGLRELRAPLLAGFLWLTCLWLWIDLPTRAEADERGGPSRALLELGDALGRPGLLAVATFAAYIIGSLSEEVRRLGTPHAAALFPTNALEWREQLRFMSLSGEDSLTRYLDDALRALATKARAKGYEDVRIPLNEPQDMVADGVHLADWETLMPIVRPQIPYDLPLIRTRLLVNHPELAAEYDRLQAEANLRYAFLLPGVALLITLAVQDSAFWLIGVVVALALAWQGVQRQREAGDVLADALLAGTVSAPVIDRYEATLEAAPERARRPRTFER